MMFCEFCGVCCFSTTRIILCESFWRWIGYINFILSVYINRCNSDLRYGANQFNKPTHLDLNSKTLCYWGGIFRGIRSLKDDFSWMCSFSRSWTAMMTSSNGSIFRVTNPLCGKFTGHRWIPHTKASDVELWFFFLICAWINGWENIREAGDLRRHHPHYDATVMAVILTKMQNKYSLSSTRSDFYQLFFFLLKTNLEIKH